MTVREEVFTRFQCAVLQSGGDVHKAFNYAHESLALFDRMFPAQFEEERYERLDRSVSVPELGLNDAEKA